MQQSSPTSKAARNRGREHRLNLRVSVCVDAVKSRKFSDWKLESYCLNLLSFLTSIISYLFYMILKFITTKSFKLGFGCFDQYIDSVLGGKLCKKQRNYQVNYDGKRLMELKKAN